MYNRCLDETQAVDMTCVWPVVSFVRKGEISAEKPRRYTVGALAGAAGGATVGALYCQTDCAGGPARGAMVFAPIGAGIGAGAGVLIAGLADRAP